MNFTSQSIRLSRLHLAVPAVACLLSGCGDYIFRSPDKDTTTPTLPTGVNNGGSGTATDALSKFTTQTGFTATAHRGLEIANSGTGIESSPALSFALTTTGFDMTTSDGTLRYDTRTSSSNVLGTNTYRACVDTCTTTSTYYDVTLVNGGSTTLQYSTYGTWTKSVANASFSRFGAFAVGVPSTEAQVPTKGTATFSGSATGLVSVDAAGSDYSFSGTATLNADFSAKTITGGITSITTKTLGSVVTTGTMNDITLSSGTISGTGFSGTATAGTTAGTLNITGATGTFSGSFYGPSATEAAGSFALTRDGLNIVGAFGTAR
jgi:hypothetical protein